MNNRYQLFAHGYQQLWGLPGKYPVAVRGKLSELKFFVEMMVRSGFEWHIVDLRKAEGEWVDRETVFKVCELNVAPCACCDSSVGEHNYGLNCMEIREA